MSGENLAKFHLGALDRVRDRALGVLGSGSPTILGVGRLFYSFFYSQTCCCARSREEHGSELPVLIVDGAVHLCQRQRPDPAKL